MSKKTTHSEFGEIQSIILKRPRDGFRSVQFISENWHKLNYLAPPDFEQSCIDYEYFEDLIAGTGARIHHLPESDSVNLDSVYCRDTILPTDHGVILCNMGKSGRSGEPEAVKGLLNSIKEPILGRIEPPGTIEGGDLAWIDEKTLAAGHGYRTNAAGIDQLKKLLSSKGIEIVVVALPHYKGPSDVFHLMSIFSPVDRKKAVVYSPLMPVNFREYLLQRKFELIEVPDAEFDSLGCNVLAIAPGKCVMTEGNPITTKKLLNAGCKVILYNGKEISAKGCGGPTCLTRPLIREV